MERMGMMRIGQGRSTRAAWPLNLRWWMRSAVALLATAFWLCGAGLASAASMIDFESVPGAAPVDKLAISNQYAASTGVSFGLDRNGDGLVNGADAALGSIVPYLEAMGADADGSDGYVYNGGPVFDQEAPAYAGQNGNFYLRPDQTYGNAVDEDFALILFFDQPMTGASGQIWDVEPESRNEFWMVSAYGSDFMSQGNAATPLASVEVSVNDERDGGAWEWAFAGQDIYAVELRYIGKEVLTGIGFDNFTVVVPEPSTAALVGLGLAVIGARARKRRTA
jgi:hypothetical protein